MALGSCSGPTAPAELGRPPQWPVQVNLAHLSSSCRRCGQLENHADCILPPVRTSYLLFVRQLTSTSLCPRRPQLPTLLTGLQTGQGDVLLPPPLLRRCMARWGHACTS
jgi:hypothetical protein